MTAVRSERLRNWRVARTQRPAPPQLSPRGEFLRASLVLLCALSVSLILELVIVSTLHEHAAQQRAFALFRAELAAGTAPIGATDSRGRQLPLGSPVAYLEVPAIGVHQVVVEGTASGTMFSGPGHRRDTPLPGQAGVSVVLGRRASFGAPFARLQELRPGASIRVTTGTGTSEYRVAGIRRQGDPAPPALSAGAGRLLLATATGGRFTPAGVLRVDADLLVGGVVGPRRLVSSATLPAPEQMLAGDPSGLPSLVLWLQALVVLTLAATWAWTRWSRAKAWLVFLSPLLVVGLSVSAEAARLLPNLL